MMEIVYTILVLGALGIVFGLVLTFADKKFAVPVDEKVARIREAVAGANCGACGYPGCDGFSAAVAKGEAPIDGCTPGGSKTLKAIAEIMGVSAQESAPKVARVLCQGATGIVKPRYEYNGLTSCALANGFAGGPSMCQYGCMGLGDCYRACKFDAIRIVNDLAVIDEHVREGLPARRDRNAAQGCRCHGALPEPGTCQRGARGLQHRLHRLQAL